MRRRAAALLALLALPAVAVAGEVIVDEGTSFALDIAPDGKHLVMDLAGHLWTLPATGGDARALTDGQRDDRLPRFSPDGRRIAYQSFGAGNWDIRVINADGSGDRRLTRAASDDREPAWSDDGRFVLFSSDRAGQFNIWRVPAGGGEPQRVTHGDADEYAAAAHGDRLAYVAAGRGGPRLLVGAGGGTPSPVGLEGNARPHAPALGPGGAVALVVTTERNGFPALERNELRVIEKSGAARVISADGADVFGFAPAFGPGGVLYYTADGGIWRHDGKRNARVPFRARFELAATDYRRRNPVPRSPAGGTVRGIFAPVADPAGRGIVFTALGDLWLRAPDGALRQLTDDPWVDRDPAFSPDGRQLAFISDRGGSTEVWLRDMDAGTLRRLTRAPRGVRWPAFSPDGQLLAYWQPGVQGNRDFTLHAQPLDGSPPRRLKAPAGWPERFAFSADGSVLLVPVLTSASARMGWGVNRLYRVDAAGELEAQRLDVPASLDGGVSLSRDGRRLAFTRDGALNVMTLNADGRPAGTPRALHPELAEYPAWQGDEALLYMAADGLARLRFGRGGEVFVERLPVRLRFEEHSGEGTLLVHAGRLFDGDGESYREDVDIVIRGGRITAVRGHRRHPRGARVIDAAEHTVLPGLIDTHGHHQGHDGEWAGRAWLAFGVTTVVEPGGMPYESREQYESWSSGRRSGPRLLFAGPQLDGALRFFPFAAHVSSVERLEQELERARFLGYSLIKTYISMPNDMQREAIARAHALGLPVSSHEIYPALANGADRTEHLRGSSRLGYSPKQSGMLRSYGDVHAIVAGAGAVLSPTVGVTGATMAYLIDNPEIGELPQYARLYPAAYRRNLATFARVVARRRALLDDGLANARAAIAALDEAGATIVAGTDAPIFPYGLSLVVELMTYAESGMGNAAALATATATAADSIGAGDTLGRVAPGRRADLVIVAGDPLKDLSALYAVQGVVRGGRWLPLETLLKRPAD